MLSMQHAIEKTSTHYNENADSGSEFLADVIAGLSAEQKVLSPKYFYDQQGSALFDEICELEEYYPFKTECALLPKVASDIGSTILTKSTLDSVNVVEFGAGSLTKVEPLLDELAVKTFMPIDISGEHLQSACASLEQRYPDIHVQPIVGDFTEALQLPALVGEQKLGFFPGSTIGNFQPEQAEHFLQAAKNTLGQQAKMLIGVDLKKDPAILHRAYNDKQGVTAKFNLNLLTRINRELNGDFDVDTFKHYAFYNTREGCVEMHLVSECKQTVMVSGSQFHFERGETIHTECSYKYNVDEFVNLAGRAGWRTQTSWVSDNGLFSMHLLAA